MPDIFLGRLEFNHGDWSRIRPTHFATASGWTPVIEPSLDFPSQGLVFVPPSLNLSRAAEGSIWVFRRAANMRGGEAPDKFVANEIAPPIPLYDFREFTLEQTRSKLCDTGLKIPSTSIRHVAIAMIGGLVAFFEVDSRQGNWWSLQQSVGDVALVNVPSGWLSSTGVAGQQYLPTLALPQLPLARRISWLSDADFVEKILLRLRRQTAQTGDQAIGLPGRDAIQRIARSLEVNGVFAQANDDIDGELERLSSLWSKVEQRFAFSDEVRDIILGSDTVKTRIESEVTAARESMLNTLRPEIANALKAEVEADLSEATGRLTEINDEIARLQVRAEQCSELAASKIKESDDESSRLARIKEQIVELSADLRRSLEQLSPAERTQVQRLPERFHALLAEARISLAGSIPRWSLGISPSEVDLISGDQLDAVLTLQAKFFGVETLQFLDAFLRAGELVLLSGPAAERAAIAYVSAVAGGEVRTFAIDPSFIGLDDLWASPNDRLPTPFAHAWCEAESSPTRPVVVRIACIDAAPMHLWLSAMASALRSPARPRNLLVMATSMDLMPNASSEPYPHATSLLQWLVPVAVSDGSNGLSALNSIDLRQRLQTMLRWETPTMGAVLKEADILQHLAGLSGQGTIRVVSLAAALGASTNLPQHLLSEWADTLAGRSSDRVDGVLAAGIQALSSLHFQA